MDRGSGQRKDLTGVRVGSLVAERCVSVKPARWLCKCDCGGSRTLSVQNFRPTKWATFACVDCKRRTLSLMWRRHGEGNTRDPKQRSRLYGIWCAMKRRCSNPRIHNYKNYGGKGIRVCDAWLRYEGFRDWANSAGYKDGLSIDRVDPGWHYDPSNCEWVEQTVNNWRAKHPGHYWRSMTCDV